MEHKILDFQFEPVSAKQNPQVAAMEVAKLNQRMVQL